jgi:hypothetical protein
MHEAIPFCAGATLRQLAARQKGWGNIDLFATRLWFMWRTIGRMLAGAGAGGVGMTLRQERDDGAPHGRIRYCTRL